MARWVKKPSAKALKSGQIGSLYGVGVFVDESANFNDDMQCCRKCGHFQFLHRVVQDEGPLPVDCRAKSSGWSQQCDPQTDHGCDCDEFVPECNLDYCVWLHDKQQNQKPKTT